MADYDLHYWPVPFRGQFIRAILAYAGKTWTEHDAEAIGRLTGDAPQDQPVPFMGPPMLVDKASGFALAQMPAIALYLGETLQLLPETAQGRALALKVVNDANDVIDEITLDGGREMWTLAKWEDFVPRLKRWMTFWETTGRAHGLAADRNFLLGPDRATIADVVTATLWGTMRERFPTIGAMLDETAPCTAALVARMQADPALVRLSAKAFEDYGESYCGGEIEASLRKVAE